MTGLSYAYFEANYNFNRRETDVAILVKGLTTPTLTFLGATGGFSLFPGLLVGVLNGSPVILVVKVEICLLNYALEKRNPK